MAVKKKKEVELDENGNPIVAKESDSKLDDPKFKELLKALEKENGSHSLLRASDDRVVSFNKIPTGIFQLDYALGGGIPVGKIALFYGPLSSMKTSLILKIIGNAQQHCSLCWTHKDLHDLQDTCEKFSKVTAAFIDLEDSFNGKWANTLGMNCDDVMVIKPSYAEKAIDTADQLLRSGSIDILVLDSLAALVPLKEVERSAEDQMMGAQAKLIGTYCRKTLNAILELQAETGRSPTVFWTNQTREKLTMFGNPETMPGGKAAPFFASTILRLEKGKAVFENDKKREEAPLYVPINFTVAKNKMGFPMMEGDFRLITKDNDEKKVGQIYDENKIMDLAEKIGLYAQMPGKRMWYFDGEEIGNAESAFERRLLIDPEFSKMARNKVMTKLLER